MEEIVTYKINHGERGEGAEVTENTVNEGDFIYNDLTSSIIKLAIEVHKELGPGLLESSYEECLSYELTKNGIEVIRQKAMPLIYKEIKMDIGYRSDLLVENKVIVEIKSVESISDVHIAQILTYLKLSQCKVGLLLNFNVSRMKDGIRRFVK